MNSKVKKRVGIYARVSTNKNKDDPNYQETENQLLQLRDHCERKGWIIHEEYIDHQSGGKSNREQLDKLYVDASKRKFDVVLFWALDRFSREGALPTLQRLNLLSHYGVDFFSYTEPWLDSTGMFKDAVIGILATISKQERVRQSERVKAGLERAKKQGKVLGRKKIAPATISRIQKLRSDGLSIRKIAREVGVSVGKVSEILNMK